MEQGLSFLYTFLIKTKKVDYIKRKKTQTTDNLNLRSPIDQRSPKTIEDKRQFIMIGTWDIENLPGCLPNTSMTAISFYF